MKMGRSVPCTANQVMVSRLQDKGYVANIPFLLRARGRLSVPVLRDALQIVLDRHEILRALFSRRDGFTYTPVTGIAIGLPLTDVSNSSDPLAAALRDLAEDGQRPFELGELPRIRARLFRFGPEEHLVSVLIDHLVADGLSLGILADEWRSLYQALTAGTPFEIAPIAPQYREFAAWQAEWLRSAEAEQLRRACAADLKGLEPRDSAVAVSGSAKSLAFQSKPSMSARLSGICLKYRVRPFVAMFACYLPLLFAVTGERDLVVATVRANRRRPGTVSMVGHFANLVPLRVRLDPARSARDFVRDVAQVCVTANARDELPFLELAGASSAVGVPPSRLAEFTINYVPFPSEPMIWDSDLRMEQVWGLFGDRSMATSRIALFIRHQSSGIGGTLVYDGRTVDPQWAACFPERLERIATQLAAGSALAVAELG